MNLHLITLLLLLFFLIGLDDNEEKSVESKAKKT